MIKRRGLLWCAFWFVLLSTPVFTVLLPSMLQMFPMTPMASPLVACVVSAVGGAFAAGFILGRLTSKSVAQFVWRGIGFGFAITVFYVIAAFAGCLVVASHYG